MKVMILAAGEGRRLLPLTQTTPKPLLRVGCRTLIERHVHALVSSGFTEIVINLFHLGTLIEALLGDGVSVGAEISYINEPQLLETGGGINNALPILGEDPFIVVSGDIYTDYPFERLPEQLPENILGHLVMIENPAHHMHGDFGLDSTSALLNHESDRFTYSGISVLSPLFFKDCLFGDGQQPRFPLRKLMDPAISAGQMSGEMYTGFWMDVGTIDRYEELQRLRG